MPIAHCIIDEKLLSLTNTSTDFVKLWSNESGRSGEHMTVNFLSRTQQFGNSYKVMANLYLPTIWGGEEVNSLQLGLEKSLEKYFNLPPGEIHIIAHLVESGHVVEDGCVEKW